MLERTPSTVNLIHLLFSQIMFTVGISLGTIDQYIDQHLLKCYVGWVLTGTLWIYWPTVGLRVSKVSVGYQPFIVDSSTDRYVSWVSVDEYWLTYISTNTSLLLHWHLTDCFRVGGTPIWNRRGCSSEILNLTPKGDHLGVAQGFCDPSRRPIWAWLKQILTPKRDRLNSAPSSLFQKVAFWRPLIVKWSP